MEIVNIYVDDEDDDFDLTDEEFDKYFRPKKRNSRKSLAPALIYDVLVKRTSPEKPLLQSELLEILKNAPYEITLERKAVGRIVHGLADSDIGINYEKGVGCWYEGGGRCA